MKAWLRCFFLLHLTAFAAAAEGAGSETEPVTAKRFSSSVQFTLREELGLQVANPQSNLNPGDILGTPRWQNRFLGSVDMKLPLIHGSGVNPLAELVVADTFVDLQNEGIDPTLAKPQISDIRNFLKEMYFNIRPVSWFFMSIGRRNITDGVGYSRNPTDFLVNPTTLPGNNFDNRFRIKNREGDVLTRFEIHWKGGSFAYTYVPKISTAATSSAEMNTELNRLTQFNRNEAHWLKAYQYVGGFDLSVHYFFRRRHQIGMGISRVFGDALELHIDASAFRGSDVQVARKIYDEVSFGQTLLMPPVYDFTARVQDQWQTHSLIGGQYTFENKLNLALEYYFNSDGYSASEQNTYFSALGVAGKYYDTPAFSLPVGNPYRLFLLSANLNFNYLSLGQHYGFIRLSDPEFFGSSNWEAAIFASSMVTSLSGMAAAELTYKVTRNCLIQAIANVFFGGPDTEGRAFYNSQAYLIAFEMQF